MGKVTEYRKQRAANLQEGIHVHDMVLKVLETPWFQEDNGHTRIEHIKWITELNRAAYTPQKSLNPCDVHYLTACDVILQYINGRTVNGYQIQIPVSDEQRLYSLVEWHRDELQKEVDKLTKKINQYTKKPREAEPLRRWCR